MIRAPILRRFASLRAPRYGSSTADRSEIEKFSRIAEQWWDPHGAFAPLHKLNPLRVHFIRDGIMDVFGAKEFSLQPFAGLKFLDIGCGGGILSESLARLGADVLAVDASAENIAVAEMHRSQDPVLRERLKYRCCLAEQLADEGQTFDVVAAMEVVEHVANPSLFLHSLTRLVKPPSEKGMIFMSTLNKTLKAYVIGVVGAEYVLGLVPKGTHDWERFIEPDRLVTMLHQAQAMGWRDGTQQQPEPFVVHSVTGLAFRPLVHCSSPFLDYEFRLDRNTDVNYLISFHRVPIV